MPTIDSASRRVPKATYVPIRVEVPSTAAGGAVIKFGYVRNLVLRPGEVDAARAMMTSGDATGAAPSASGAPDAALWAMLKLFEGAPLPAQLPAPSAFAAVPVAVLRDFGQQVVDARRLAVSAATAQPGATGLLSVTPAPGAALNALNTGIVAIKGFEANVTATPIGMLNLERLEMTPAGIERGELLATIPLAPNEKTAVIQKEWSVTTKEFTSIVTDSLETVSVTGVTENTELAQSTNSQVQHSNQFNINATVSGGFGFVTGSVATSFGSQDANSRSATDSRKHAIETTRKASSRVKQEHKTTISTTTVTGTSETTTRMLENPSATDPMRIDYFSLIRKWRVRLFRYGLRLTYDIAIPEPGAAMRETFERLATLQTQAAKAFEFHVTHSQITPLSYQALAEEHGAQVPEPPAESLVQVIGGIIPGLQLRDDDFGWHFAQLPVTIPEGYQVSDVTLEIMLASVGHARQFYVLGSGLKEDIDHDVPGATYDLTVRNRFMLGYRGNQQITYYVNGAGSGVALFTITQQPTAEEKARWVASVWNALYNAAQAAFFAEQQSLNVQIQALRDEIDGVDTLTLRREESDEIMKGVLRWLLGTGFDFMPKEVVDLFKQSGADLQHGIGFTRSELGISSTSWTTMFQYQEMVKFINEAIEWENVLYFLYSYFWDVPQSWDFIRQIRHQDWVQVHNFLLTRPS